MNISGRTLAVVFGMLSVSAIGWAQDQPVDTGSLRQGAWALEFGIGSNFTLTSFQGSLIGIQYQYSACNAARLSVSFDGQFLGGTGLTSFTEDGVASGPSSNDDVTRSFAVSVVIQNVWFMNPRDVVRGYIAAGPVFSYAHNHSDQSSTTPPDPFGQSPTYWATTTSQIDENRWGLGARGAVGIEWCALRWLGVRAEYLLDVQYQWQNQSGTSTTQDGGGGVSTLYRNEQSSSFKGWVLSSLGVSFGVNVYF